MSGDGSHPIDPDLLLDRLGQVLIITDSPVDVIWPFSCNWDPEELLSLRRHQKMWLARYGRQSLFEWEDRDTTELRDYYDELVALMGKEKGVTVISPEDV